jgi:hypothetical protein
MSSVVQSKNRLSRHKTPSRRIAANAGQPAPRSTPVRPEAERLKENGGASEVSTYPVGRGLRLTRTASSNATRQDGQDGSLRNLRESGGNVQPESRFTLKRVNAIHQLQVERGTGNRTLTSHPDRRGCGARAVNNGCKLHSDPLEVDDVGSYGVEGGTPNDATRSLWEPGTEVKIQQREKLSEARELAIDTA